MVQRISFALLASTIISSTAIAQSSKQIKYTKLKSGLEYNMVTDAPGTKKATEGSMITMHIRTLVGDSTLFDSYKMNDNKPVPAQVSKPSFNGDVMEGIALMTAGDSALFRVPADSVFRNGQKPPFVKAGDQVVFQVKLVTVQTKEEYAATQKASAGKQNEIDDKLIQDYVKKNNLKTQKTASGIYYIVDKKGNGKHAVASDKVKVHYKGTHMDGTTFDSSYDRGQPIDFPLSGVIKGWTEGIPLFEEGGKGKLIIPSSLAYGQNAPPGSTIKENEILIFDVELLEILKN